MFPGLSGVLLGDTNLPPVKRSAGRIYLLSSNGGDSGPTYWHWLAGMGTPEAIRYWVLSDQRNEVRGEPRRIRTVQVGGRDVEIWRFPEHPGGGQFGGHLAAITRSAPYLAIASVHGYDTANTSPGLPSPWHERLTLAADHVGQPGSAQLSVCRRQLPPHRMVPPEIRGWARGA